MNEERIGNFEKRTHRGRIWAGMFLLIIGGLLLLKSMNYILFPAWIFTWPVILIAIGLFSGVQHGFRGGFWLIMILIGGLFLLNDINPTLQLRRYIGPLAIIAIGLVFILKPRRHNWRRWKYGDAQNETNSTTGIPGNVTVYPTESTDRTDFIDITSVFSGVKKNILSKNFKGGDIVCFMGGSEINLTQADFTGRIKIDTTNIFGG
ncbi:MAG: LiaF transmembrane domain-containing protein, partial [Flavisolibacter sp.]